MKRFLAVLALITIAFGSPLPASAGHATGDVEMNPQPEIKGVEVSFPPRNHEDIEQDQHDGNGDPHDLGGGFRGAGSTLDTYNPWPVPVGPIVRLIARMY